MSCSPSSGDRGASEPGRGFSFWAGWRLPALSQHCCAYLRNAESPLSAGHRSQREMTISTKATYDCKCHVLLTRGAGRAASGWCHCTQWIPDLACRSLLSDPPSSLRSSIRNRIFVSVNIYYRIYFGCIGGLVFGDMNFNNHTAQCLALFFFPINPWCIRNLNVHSAEVLLYFLKSSDQSKIWSRLEAPSCCSDL